MFIKPGCSGYNRNGQWSRSLYLFMVEHPRGMTVSAKGTSVHKLYACVRDVRLHQLGHFMMGRIRIGGKSIAVSGPIASDGLPHHCGAGADHTFEDLEPFLTEVPLEVTQAYWADDGHNDVGSSRGVLTKWARENLKQLKERRGKREPTRGHEGGPGSRVRGDERQPNRRDQDQGARSSPDGQGKRAAEGLPAFIEHGSTTAEEEEG